MAPGTAVMQPAGCSSFSGAPRVPTLPFPETQAELEALRRQLAMQAATMGQSPPTGGSGGLASMLANGLGGLGGAAGAAGATGLPASALGLPFTVGMSAPQQPRQLGLKVTRPPSLHQLAHEEQALQQQKRHASGGSGAGGLALPPRLLASE